MSEKRFSWIAEKTGQHYEISIRDGDKEYTISDDFFKSKDVVAVIVDLLNNLNDENGKLRKELDSFKPVMFQDVRKGTVILYSKGKSVYERGRVVK